MWQKSGNSEAICPPSVERSGKYVIVRREFKLIEATDDIVEHYEWYEWQMTADQYDVYRTLDTQMSEQSDALVELAELISEVIDNG